MDYMSNTFPSEQDSIRLTDFYKICSSILKRELSSEEKSKLSKIIPSSSRCVKSKKSFRRWDGRKGNYIVSYIPCQ